jgi:hypothetical protein
LKVPPVVGPAGVIALPQLSLTAGGNGWVALAIQATVDEPLAGIVKSLRSIV